MELPKLKQYFSNLSYEAIICREDYGLLTEAEAAEVIRRCEAHDGLVKALEAAQTMLLQTDWNGEDAMAIVNNAVASEGEPNDPVLAAAEKCAKTGNRKDLQEYLKARRNLR